MYAGGVCTSRSCDDGSPVARCAKMTGRVVDEMAWWEEPIKFPPPRVSCSSSSWSSSRILRHNNNYRRKLIYIKKKFFFFGKLVNSLLCVVLLGCSVFVFGGRMCVAYI